MTIIPMRPVATQTAKSRSTIAPQAIIGARLFHTSFMLVPMAVSASTRRSRSIGTEKTLMAKAKAANKPPIAVPTTSMVHPYAVPKSTPMMWSRPGNGVTPKKSAQRSTAARIHRSMSRQRSRPVKKTCAPARGRTRSIEPKPMALPSSIARLFS